MSGADETAVGGYFETADRLILLFETDSIPSGSYMSTLLCVILAALG